MVSHFHILMLKLVHLWVVGASSSWLLHLFAAIPSRQGMTRCSSLIEYTSCPGAEMSHFSKELGLLLAGNDI